MLTTRIKLAFLSSLPKDMGKDTKRIFRIFFYFYLYYLIEGEICFSELPRKFGFFSMNQGSCFSGLISAMQNAMHSLDFAASQFFSSAYHREFLDSFKPKIQIKEQGFKKV